MSVNIAAALYTHTHTVITTLTHSITQREQKRCSKHFLLFLSHIHSSSGSSTAPISMHLSSHPSTPSPAYPTDSYIRRRCATADPPKSKLHSHAIPKNCRPNRAFNEELRR